jgi:SCP-2 sterol transfer family protein
MAAAKPKKSRTSGSAPRLDTAIEQLSARLSSCRAVRKGATLLIRATGEGGGDFHLEASEQAVRVTKAPAMPPAAPTLEIMGDARRLAAVIGGHKDARKEFLAGGFRVRGDLRYLSDVAMELGLLKIPL